VTFNKNNVIGKRGTLTVGSVTFENIERGGNFVSLKSGRFLLTMTEDASRGQVFIVQPDGKYGHNVPTLSGGKAGIMIHSADTPDDLTGCLAPGKSFDAASGTLLQSSEALTDILRSSAASAKPNWPAGSLLKTEGQTDSQPAQREMTAAEILVEPSRLAAEELVAVRWRLRCRHLLEEGLRRHGWDTAP
jgi:hypothetical protein